jgi:hypothetical protein
MNKATMIPSPTKATDEEKQFIPSLSDFRKETILAPGSKLFYDKSDLPCVRVEKDSHYLEYEILSPYTLGSGSLQSSLSLDTRKEHLDFDNYKVEIESRDFRAKVDITLKSIPDSNQIKIKVDTNLNPFFDLGSESGGYKHVYFSPTSKQSGAVYMLDTLHIHDANGSYTQGRYMGFDDKGYLVIEIDQAWLSAAIYPVVVDPTVQQMIASLPYAGTITCGEWADYNSSRYVAFFDTGAGSNPVIMTTTDLTTSSTDEFGNSPFLATDAFRTAVVHFSDGDQLFFGIGTTGITCALWTVGGTWDGSTTLAGTSVNFNNGLKVTVDENDNVYLMYVSANPFILRKSTDKGKTWNTMTAPGVGDRDTNQSYALSANENGELELFYHTGTGVNSLPYLKTYNISGNSWSGVTAVGSQNIVWRGDHPWRVQRESDGSTFLLIHDPVSGGRMKWTTNRTGSWVSGITVGVQGSGEGYQFIDDNDDHYLLKESASNVYLWDKSTTWSLTGDSPWFSGYDPIAGRENPSIAALRSGEPFWCVGKDGSATYWMQNTTYTFLAGGNGDGIYSKSLISGTMTRDAKTTPLSNTFTEV